MKQRSQDLTDPRTYHDQLKGCSNSHSPVAGLSKSNIGSYIQRVPDQDRHPVFDVETITNILFICPGFEIE